MNIYESLPASDPSLPPSSPSLQPSSPYLQPSSPYFQPSSPYFQPFSPSLPPSSSSLPTPNSPLPTSNPSVLPQKKTSSVKRKKKTEDDRRDKAFEILTATAALNFTSDELQDFGNFVAKKLRKYTSRTQGIIHNAIMGIFLNADNGLYEQGYQTYGIPINPSLSNNNPTMSMRSEDSNQSCTYTSSASDTIQVSETSQVNNTENIYSLF